MAKSANRIGVLGGTFDPVHLGHVALATAALKQLSLDRVYLLLSPRSPFKLDQVITPVIERSQMLALALKGEKNILMGDWELAHPGPSYTVTTLARHKKRHPSDELFLILGSDALASFRSWKDPDRILKLASLVVGRRPGTDIKMSDVEGQIIFLRGLFPEISSTRIRKEARKAGAIKGVSPAVAQYIRKNHLYEF